MNLVDSSAWIEFFARSARADLFVPAIRETDELLVPTIVVCEVFKHLARTRDKQTANQALGALYQGQVVDLDVAAAIEAARLSLLLGLPMADSIILAVCRAYGAVLWTQDAHFAGLPDVKYYPKNPGGGDPLSPA